MICRPSAPQLSVELAWAAPQSSMQANPISGLTMLAIRRWSLCMILLAMDVRVGQRKGHRCADWLAARHACFKQSDPDCDRDRFALLRSVQGGVIAGDVLVKIDAVAAFDVSLFGDRLLRHVVIGGLVDVGQRLGF